MLSSNAESYPAEEKNSQDQRRQKKAAAAAVAAAILHPSTGHPIHSIRVRVRVVDVYCTWYQVVSSSTTNLSCCPWVAVTLRFFKDISSPGAITLAKKPRKHTLHATTGKGPFPKEKLPCEVSCHLHVCTSPVYIV